MYIYRLTAAAVQMPGGGRGGARHDPKTQHTQEVLRQWECWRSPREHQAESSSPPAAPLGYSPLLALHSHNTLCPRTRNSLTEPPVFNWTLLRIPGWRAPLNRQVSWLWKPQRKPARLKAHLVWQVSLACAGSRKRTLSNSSHPWSLFPLAIPVAPSQPAHYTGQEGKR